MPPPSGNALERHLGTPVLQELSRYRENLTSRKKRTVFERKATLVFYFPPIFLKKTFFKHPLLLLISNIKLIIFSSSF